MESSDPKSCINAQLASEDKAHEKAEADAIAEALRKVPELAKARTPAPGATVSLPFVPALFGGSSNQRGVRITYRRNDKAGGLLFGGDSDDGTTPDSEYGPDLRLQSGNLVMRRTDEFHCRFENSGPKIMPGRVHFGRVQRESQRSRLSTRSH